MDEQNRNLILATALSFLVILVWFILFPPPEQQPQPETAPATAEAPVAATAPGAAPAGTTTEATPAGGDAADARATAEAPRVAIDTPRVKGSISLLGGRIDDLHLKDYRETIEPDSPIVTVLSPVGSEHAYYALHGWAPAPGTPAEDVPGPRTLWRAADGARLGVDTPLVLEWTSPGGLHYTRRIEIDEDYMFRVTQSVRNDSGREVALAPYGLIVRHGEPPDLKNFFILHEGVVRMADGELAELGYDDLQDLDPGSNGARVDSVEAAENGWIGFTDHYWMAVLVPESGTPFRARASYYETRDLYQTEAIQPARTVKPGETASVTTRLFAGAKEWEVIRDYERAGVVRFTDSIDWGWFFFLTKPIFIVLHWLNQAIGNMGWAIIGLTLVIKSILFPLAYKSYVSMAKMKELQPEMEKIKERVGDDRQKLQQEMMELYRREKVNPASGCLPILLQIPIFFSLYKVIFVTLDLRHAPWILWIRDLSAPDPTSWMNLFGLLPWAPPDPTSLLSIFSIGVLPILLGISMWLQQKLNPAPPDPTQAAIFAWMPWVFMFMLGRFASGLVLYWIVNNTITFIQQYIIMRSHGHKPDVLGNILSSFRRKAEPDKK